MALSPVMVELRASIGEFRSRMAEARGEVAKLETESRTHMAKFQAFGKVAFLGVGAAALSGAVVAVKAAGDYQESLTQLVTGAGESEKNIRLVGDGMLKMAGDVGIGAQELAKGMYPIESAGYHGAAGLQVLHAAAEGVRVSGADLATVADGLTTAMNDYHIPAEQAALTTSKLVTAVSLGKTHMQDLAGALATVLPIASTAKVGLDQVLGAMSTMTALGTPAADAATYLKQTIAQLSNPTAKAAHEMKGLGLSSIDISSHLGQRGLTGTLEVLTNAIKSKMGPAGTVLIESLKKSAGNATAFQKILANLPPTQQTYVGALATMVGGTKSMQAALELTGSNAKTFADNVKTVSATTTEAGNHVKGTALAQKDLNNKMKDAVAAFKSVVIIIGEKLIPILTKALDWLSKHKAVVIALTAVVAGGLVAAMVAFAVAFVAANTVIVAIVAGIVALAAGFTYAWQKSEVFRDVVIGVVDMVKMGFYKMVYEGLGMFRVWLMAWLETAGGILHGARLMLSWVPGLGDKLKHADDAFRGFKDGALSTIDKLRDGMHEKMLAATVQTAYQSALTGQALKHGIEDRLPAYLAIADKYGKTLPQVLKDARLPAKDAATIMAQAANTGFASGQPGAAAASNQMGRGLVDGVQAHVGLAAQAGQNLALGARNGVAGVGGFDTLGSNAGQGFVNGLQSMMQPVSDAAFNMAKIATDAVAAAHNTHSPSQVFHELGRNAGLGLALGMRSTRRGVAEAALDIAQAARDAIADAHEHHGPRAHHPRHHAGAGHAGHHPHAPHIPRVTHHPRPTGLPAGRACIPVCKPGQGGSPGAQSATIDLHVILDGREIHRSVQTHELQYQARNSHSSTAVSKGSSRAC